MAVNKLLQSALALCVTAMFVIAEPPHIHARSMIGDLEDGVKLLKKRDDGKALDIFTEVWTDGNAEEKKLASYYMNILVTGTKGYIPSIEEARARIKMQADVKEAAGEVKGESEPQGSSNYAGRVKPTAVIYHNVGRSKPKKTARAARSYVQEEEETPAPVVKSKPKAKAKPKPQAKPAGPSPEMAELMKKVAHLERKLSSVESQKAYLKASFDKANTAKSQAMVLEAQVSSLKKQMAVLEKRNKEEAAKRPTGKDSVVLGKKVVPGGVNEVVELGPGRKPESLDVSVRSSDVKYEETKIVEPINSSEITVQDSEGNSLDEAVPASQMPKEDKTPVVADSVGGDETGNVAMASLGNNSSFAIEDAYAPEGDTSSKGETAKELLFDRDAVDLKENYMGTIAEAVKMAKDKDVITVRGMASPLEKNPDSLSKVRAKLVERLLKKKFDVSSKRINVEWGVGINQEDQKVLLIIKS